MNFEVNEAVWLAAVAMTYDVLNHNHNATIEDISFKQTDIQKKAQSYTDKNIDNARISQWCNADHRNNTSNFLRDTNGKRRIVYSGEFKGIKEHPNLKLDELIEIAPDVRIPFGDLLNFLEVEYKPLFTVQFDKIINHLQMYANMDYINPIKVEEDEKQIYLAIRESGSAAVNELNKLSNTLANKYGLMNKNKSKWLNGGNDKVRGYLWNQLKYEDCMEIPTSISIFAEKRNENKDVQFRISIELDEKLAKKEDYVRHHQMLSKPLISGDNYFYYIKQLHSRDSEVSHSTNKEIQAKVESGEYKKVQVVYELTNMEIEEDGLTNELISQKLESAFENLMDYYKLVVKRDLMNEPLDGDEGVNEMYEKNMILYGPPGTGKTYSTVIYSVAIIENQPLEVLFTEDYQQVLKRYNDYKKSGQINFTTFHQSYGYEEFIEGIKPLLDEEQNDQLQYKIEPGIFKAFCENAQQLKVTTNDEALQVDARVWKVSLGGSGINELKDDCFENNRIRIGWDGLGELDDDTVYPSHTVADILHCFYDDMSVGDIVFSLGDQKHIDAIGVITGAPQWLENEEHYKRSRAVKWIATNINEYIYELNGKKNLTLKTIYELKRISKDNVNELILKYSKKEQVTVEENKKNYVFIIDEINRGNISKILGELITLIEPTKRIGAKEQMKVRLSYSKEEFGVPQNVYLLGTMNTADRSIAMMDTALRRRFNFIEVMPNVQLLESITVGNINIQKMLEVINKRIEALYDREHTIGHSYFMSLKDDPSIDNLARIFENAIIPLLQEYFYEDFSKIQLVLGDNAKDDEYKFILDVPIQVSALFKSHPDIDIPEKRYEIQIPAFKRSASYTGIYE